MPYVQRDELGRLIGLLKEPGDSGGEFLSAAHPEVLAFLSEGEEGEDGQFSPLTDLQMVRVIEDLIDLLIAKNLIVLTDLPTAVQKKLLHQRTRRASLFGDVSMPEDDEKGLF